MKKIIIFVLLISFFTSCKKDKDKTCKQDMAGMSGTYKVTAVTYKSSAGAAEQDVYTTFFATACERDDLYVLNSNGSYNYTDAGVKCNPAGDFSGTWSVNGNTGSIDGDAAAIQNFSCSGMVIIIYSYATAGDQLKLTFARQ